MGVASGCGEQEVGVASGSGWNLWVWLLGVVLRRYIDFLILLIPTPLVSVLFFAAASLLFCSFLKMFFVLVPVLFKNDILGIKYFFRLFLHVTCTSNDIIPHHCSAGKAACACGLAPLDRTSVYI